MKILFLANGLGVGGAETQLVTLMDALEARGHAVSLVTLNTDERIADRLPPHRAHRSLGAARWWDAPRVALSFRRLLREERPDVVHAHLLQANLLSRLTKWTAPGTRVVNTTHCSYDLDRRRYDPYAAYRWTRRWVDVHTAVSGPALEDLRRRRSVDPPPSRLVPNALDVSRYRRAEPGSAPAPGTDEPFRWIAVGRLDPVKNYGLLLDAVARVRDAGLRLELDVAGEGAERAALEARAAEARLDGTVRFLGLIRDLPERLSRYHGYVLSSENEALPMALLEAMAAGLPVVGTEVGDVPALLRASGGGRTAPPGDAAALAAAMEEIQRADRSVLDRMGAENRAHVESAFGPDRIATVWEAIYRGDPEPADRVPPVEALA